MVRNVGFKPYHQDQTLLLPLSLDEFIPANHNARIISTIVDKLDLSALYDKYCTTTGQNAYDPRMLVKVLFYATFKGIFSSRAIENELHTDTAFLYLSAMQKPTYRTISRFRSNFFDELEEIFEQIVQICLDLDLAGLNHVAFDGSKIKANASPKKAMTQVQLKNRIRKLLKKSILTDEEEDALFGDGSPYSFSEELTQDDKIMKEIERLIEAYSHLQDSDAKRICLTDEDANVMKIGRQRLPGYNIQAAVDDKAHVIVAADVTTEENDYHQLVPMMKQVVHNTGRNPEIISADPGFATYDNYQFLEDNGFCGLIPDNMHFVDTCGQSKYFTKSRFLYDSERDQYTCPAGRTMRFVRTQKDKNGEFLRLYQGNCSYCPLHLSCTKATRRTISRHPREELISKMRARLATPEGKAEYAKRITVAEAPFGNMKANKRWRELSHRGLKKVKGECLLHVIGHNLGVICKHASIEKVKNLTSARGVSYSVSRSSEKMLRTAESTWEGEPRAGSCHECSEFAVCWLQNGEPGPVAGIICA